MVTREFARFEEIAQVCGNRFMAVNLVAKAARKLGNKYKSAAICESKLIEWVLTGECPYPKYKFATRQLIRETLDDVEDRLCFVDDEEIKDEVRNCYKQSIRNKHLTLCTRTDINKNRVSRINILLRMIWYHFKEEDDDVDSYLENLVPKATVEPEPVVETPAEVPEPEGRRELFYLESESALVCMQPTSTLADIDKPVEEVVVELVEKEPAAEELTTEEQVAQVTERKDGDLISIPVGSMIKVYRTPDPRQPFKSVSGNVIYKGKHNGFTIIDYMKPCFGLVRGYTPDIE